MRQDQRLECAAQRQSVMMELGGRSFLVSSSQLPLLRRGLAGLELDGERVNLTGEALRYEAHGIVGRQRSEGFGERVGVGGLFR